MSAAGSLREAAALYRAGRVDEAKSIAEGLVGRDPRDFYALHLLGTIALTRGEAEECVRLYERALAVDTGHVEARCNRAIAWRMLGQPQRALDDYRAALAAKPDSVEALTLCGVALAELNRHAEARSHYDRALAIDPRYAVALYNRALQDLTLGRFDTGWDGYEARFDTQPPMSARRTFGLRRAGAEDLRKGTRVALWREQGLGDQILFATLLPELLERDVSVVAEVDPRLIGAFRRAFPTITFVVPQEAAAAFARCEVELAFGSLPRFLRPSVASFSRQPPALLAADPALVHSMRARIGARRVGVSWRSFQAAGRRRYADTKSMPLEHFGALANRGVPLLDLQYGDAAEERTRFEEQHPGSLLNLGGLDAFNDLEGMLAAIEACDLVATTSNVTAHLAGAIGKRTLLFYPSALPPFHYWAAGPDGRSLWYPSVEIVSDPAWSVWGLVIEAVARKVVDRGAT